MKILSFETTMRTISVAYYDGNKMHLNTIKSDTRDQSAYLPEFTNEVIHNNQLDTLDYIIITVGPGSYTGIRAGLSFAKGLSLALQKPLVGLSSFSPYFAKIFLEKGQEKNTLIVLDSKRDQFFVQQYMAKEKAFSKPFLTSYSQLHDTINNESDALYISGNLPTFWNNQDFSNKHQIMDYNITAIDSIHCFLNKLCPEYPVEPIYLREADVTIRKSKSK